MYKRKEAANAVLSFVANVAVIMVRFASLMAHVHDGLLSQFSTNMVSHD